MLLGRSSGTEIGLEQILNQITELALRIRQSSDLNEMLNVTVNEAREILESDRVVVYRFQPDGDGVVASESVNPECTSILGQVISDPCFAAKCSKQYQQGRLGVLRDINAKPIEPCYRDLLIQLQIRANLVVPIRVKSKENQEDFSLWGLLIAHQCNGARQWHSLEIKYLQLVAAQLEIALQLQRSPQQFQCWESITKQTTQTLKPLQNTYQEPQSKATQDCISMAELAAFERLQTPIWIFDVHNLRMWWANKAALYLWNAETREELLNRDYSDISESTRIRMHSYLHQFQQGQTIAEDWTFYPEGKPTTVRCFGSGVHIGTGQMAILAEGITAGVEQFDFKTLRSIEALRHTSVMISLYTMEGVPLIQNPSALRCYGDILHPNPCTENIFLSHFVNPKIGQQAMSAILSGEVFSVETQVSTTQGIRWHGLDARCTRDPVTGNAAILVNEKDITVQQVALFERQRAEEQLRWKEALLRAMTDTSQLAFFVVDNRTDEILYFNHRFCEIWGIEHLEMQMQQGKLKKNDIISDCLRLIADVTAFSQSCKILQSTEHRSPIEDELVFIDGRTIRRFSSQIRGSQDQYFGRLYIYEDITERKQLEKAIRLSDFSFESLALAASWLKKDGRVLRVNAAACHSLGYSRDELESMSVFDLDPDFPKEVWVHHWQELKQQKHMTFITQHRRKDGQVFPVEVNANYLEFNGEEYNFAFSRDISDRLKAEAALRESEERYRSVIAAMAEGVVLQQANGEITAFNESAERILGLTADQMMGRTSVEPQWRIIHEDGSPFPGATYPAMVTLRTGQPQFNVIMGVHKPDSSFTWISVNSQPLFHPNQSQPYAVVASFTDITLRKQAEQVVRQQAQRERMIYAIAQNIRQSLDLDDILNTAVAEVRHFLQTERVIIYRFNPDGSGVVVKESVAEGWISILNMQTTDCYYVESQGRSNSPNTISVIPDIYTAGFSPSYLELLVQLQVRSQLIVPILQIDSLWGLLVVHNCRAAYEWQTWESELLQQLATQLAIAIQQSELYQRLQIANQQLENLAMVDQLTQIANRRCFDCQLEDVWHHSRREKHPLSLLLCDIDYFKQYNDTYGHTTGDTCLTLVAQALKQTVKRTNDIVARYGGEEFAVILVNTNSDGAIQVAQEIHQAIHALNIPHVASGAAPFVTVSIGIATIIPSTEMTPLDLIESADLALYQAKLQGRNRNCVGWVE